MSEKKLVRINLATIGHVDHGKTTLTAALSNLFGRKENSYTSVADVDTAPEEQERGITINVSTQQYFIERDDKTYVVAHQDCPGHRDFVKNTIAGIGLTDIPILVVSAKTGVMAQTEEHVKLMAVSLGGTGSKNVSAEDNPLKNKTVGVLINKIDLCDPDQIDMELEFVEETVVELLTELGFSQDKIIVGKTSAKVALDHLCGEKADNGQQYVDNLKQFMENLVDDVSFLNRPIDKPFSLTVDNVLSIQGRGTVLTGVVKRGTLKIGDTVELIGSKKMKTANYTVIGIEAFHTAQESCKAGDNVGILLRGLDKNTVKRGMMVVIPGSAKIFHGFEGQLYLLSKEEGGRQYSVKLGYEPHGHIGSNHFTLRLVGAVVDEKMQYLPGSKDVSDYIADHNQMVVAPGDHCRVHFDMAGGAVLVENTSIILRESGKTIGVVKVIKLFDEIRAPKKK